MEVLLLVYSFVAIRYLSVTFPFSLAFYLRYKIMFSQTSKQEVVKIKESVLGLIKKFTNS